jgi:hypothetical protein
LQALSVYGYGGDQVLASASETVTVSESEPNDSQGEAMSVSLGTEIAGQLERAGVDWFAFDADSGETVTARFTRSATDGVTSVVLYGPDGDFGDLVFVGSDDPVDLVETVETAGTHYVEVVDVQNSDGDYTLALTSGSTSTSTPTPTSTPTVTATPTATTVEDDYGEQSYGEYGYGGVDA